MHFIDRHLKLQDVPSSKKLMWCFLAAGRLVRYLSADRFTKYRLHVDMCCNFLLHVSEYFIDRIGMSVNTGSYNTHQFHMRLHISVVFSLSAQVRIFMMSFPAFTVVCIYSQFI